MDADALNGPTQQGLAEVADIARANVRSAIFANAAIVDDRYALTFRVPSANVADREKVLDEMERALNRYRPNPADPTSIELQFD
ncbi:hypothetical protein LMIY3S_04742 [Labrys miyagiensis]